MSAEFVFDPVVRVTALTSSLNGHEANNTGLFGGLFRYMGTLWVCVKYETQYGSEMCLLMSDKHFIFQSVTT